MSELPKAYNPQDHEEDIKARWNESGYFNPDKLELPEDAPSYTVILPPPNVTDRLHLGHASMLAIQDLLVRFHRMNGYRTLWLPGTDHAAIATQNVVERKIFKEEGKSRHDFSREEFFKRVYDFALETQGTIIGQIKAFGASLDWSRLAFTLDETRQRAVKKMFIDMYEAGAIYRGERIVNWCPRCQSTLADDEVEYKEEKTVLYTFKYWKDFPIAISTTRPETKLGDTAVAVNPKDERYAQFIGQEFSGDFCGQTLKIKIIADREVDMAFGTGALGVTPAHSAIDWRMAEVNNLPIIKVIDEAGSIHTGFGAYSGKTAADARVLVIEALNEHALIEKEEEITHNVSTCYRCNTVIEPLPSKQWFVAVDKPLVRLNGKSLKQAALEASENLSINFVPDRFKKRYEDWMKNLRDWCISRQIIFGHSIPVWYDEAGEVHIPAKRTVLLARHGESEANIDWLFEGISNSTALTSKGQEQAKALGTLLKDRHITSIICSDLTRSRQTAEIVAAEIGYDISQITVLEDMREIEPGALCGQSYKDYLSGTRHIIESGLGEDLDSLERRVLSVFDTLNTKPAGSTILVIGHNAFNSFLRAHHDGKGKDEYVAYREKIGYVPNTSYVEFDLLEDPKEAGLRRDTDTLDTWFSSGMWTFSTLGWPDTFSGGAKSGDLLRFHPTDVLETGYEIITLWVSRMIMMSLFAIGEIPFKNVYLHGMVLDKHGKKMSKSKGNGIDPVGVGQQYGTDAVRLALLIGNTPGVDVRLSEEKIESFRNFVNKLWNVSRFIMSREAATEEGDLSLADHWIASRFAKTNRELTEKIKAFDFSGAGDALRSFTLDDLADWYIEASKFSRSRASDNFAKELLVDTLKLWHPFMPFVTEVIWKELCPTEKLLLVASWPTLRITDIDEVTESEFELIRSIIGAIRNLRSEHAIEPARKLAATIYAGENIELIEACRSLICSMRTGIEKLEIKVSGSAVEGALYATINDIDMYLEAPVDVDAERTRLEKEISYINDGLKACEAKLANVEFKEKAPAQLVLVEEKKRADYITTLEKLNTKLSALG